MGDLPRWKECEKQSHYDGWPTPNGKKGRVVSFLWVTYPGEEWPHYNGCPTQVKKMENGLILMGDLPKWKGGRVVSFFWVTYPKGKNDLIIMGDLPQGEEWPHYNGWPTQVKKDGEWSHSNGWPTHKKWSHCDGWPTQVEKGKSGLILMGDLPRGKNDLIMMGDLPR